MTSASTPTANPALRREPLIAVYDACVLFSQHLRDFLVRLAIHGRRTAILRAKWTGRIHGEWVRAVCRQRPDLDRARLLRTCRLMDQHVRGCRVEGYLRWERRLTLPDSNDRHVLAAALACVADVIVTNNVRDFPADILSPFGVVAETPDAFVGGLLARQPELVFGVAAEHRAALNRPPMSATEYLAALSRSGLPQTAAALPVDRCADS